MKTENANELNSVMNKDNITDFLRKNPFFWSRLGFCYDPPRAGKDGKQIIFSRDFEDYRRVHRQFADAGVKLHTTILHSGWVADGKFDYTLTDEILDEVFRGNPDIYYMPRVKLNVPPDWCRNHPEDTFVYYFGPRDAESISALAETPEQDYFGFDSDGYSVNGGKGVWKDDRVNRGGLIGLQSFSSEKWVADASDALRRLLVHLSESRYADRIIGVHVAYGMCGETNLWGSWSPLDSERTGLCGHRGDFGITNRRRFREYGIQKYKSESGMLEKWGDPEPPTPLAREEVRDSLDGMFFPEGSKERDYFEFVSETNADAIEAYCRIVKESSPLFGHELCAGVFYGYMYLPQAANAGHLALRRIIDSEYVDFLSSPKGYFRCLAGDPGGEQGPSESVARKKAWLDEIDDHTHLDRRPEGRAANEDESLTLLWREAVKNITHDQGFWWMDLGEGWYDSPGLMGAISRITSLQSDIADIPSRSAAEILLVVDDGSLAATSVSYGLNFGLMYQLHSELKLCGAPVDTLLLDDMLTTDLSRYKMIVFANCFRFDEGERERILGKVSGKLVVWHYAAGIMAPGCSPDNYTRLTGFGMREIERWDDVFCGYSSGYSNGNFRKPGDFPLFSPDPDGAEVYSVYPNGDPMCCVRANTVVCACPSLKAADFREFARRAGVTIMCPSDCAVFADNRVAGFFPKEGFDGEITLGNEKLKVSVPAKGRLIFRIRGGRYERVL